MTIRIPSQKSIRKNCNILLTLCTEFIKRMEFLFYYLFIMNNLDNKEIVPATSKSVFLDKAILIDGVASYYDKILDYKGRKYVITIPPQESFYKDGRYLVNVIDVTDPIQYGAKANQQQMIFKDGRIMPIHQ